MHGADIHTHRKSNKLHKKEECKSGTTPYPRKASAAAAPANAKTEVEGRTAFLERHLTTVRNNSDRDAQHVDPSAVTLCWQVVRC
jgi:hypothetical protein